MFLPSLLVAGLLLAPSPVPDDRTADFDPSTDFSQFKTFALGQARLRSPKPELNNDIVKKKVQDAIRSELVKRGLREESVQGADVVVSFGFGSFDKREVESFPVGRWGRGRAYSATSYSEGTLVVDVLKRPGRDLVWRGTYRDDESNASKISSNLPRDVEKLFDKYPVKKK
jgi:hypothetical protein